MKTRHVARILTLGVALMWLAASGLEATVLTSKSASGSWVRSFPTSSASGSATTWIKVKLDPSGLRKGTWKGILTNSLQSPGDTCGDMWTQAKVDVRQDLFWTSSIAFRYNGVTLPESGANSGFWSVGQIRQVGMNPLFRDCPSAAGFPVVLGSTSLILSRMRNAAFTAAVTVDLRWFNAANNYNVIFWTSMWNFIQAQEIFDLVAVPVPTVPSGNGDHILFAPSGIDGDNSWAQAWLSSNFVHGWLQAHVYEGIIADRDVVRCCPAIVRFLILLDVTRVPVPANPVIVLGRSYT